MISLFQSGLSMEEIEKTSEERAEQYRKVPGLVQKYYVFDKALGRIGGIFVFDTFENLQAFQESDLARSTAEAYKFQGTPHGRVLEIAKVLRES